MAIYERTILTKLDSYNGFALWNGNLVYVPLVLESYFSCDVVKGGFNTPLELTSVFTANLEAQRTITTTLVVESVFSVSLLNLHHLNTPIDLFNDPTLLDPRADLPHNFTDPGNNVVLTFQFFFPVNTLVLTLNAPEFGDTDKFRKIKEQKYSRGGTLVLFDVIGWGSEKIFEYSFNDLNAVQKKTLLDLFRSSLGKYVKIIDHLGITRTGFILTPESDIFNKSEKGFDATFSFQQVS